MINRGSNVRVLFDFEPVLALWQTTGTTFSLPGIGLLIRDIDHKITEVGESKQTFAQ